MPPNYIPILFYSSHLPTHQFHYSKLWSPNINHTKYINHHHHGHGHLHLQLICQDSKLRNNKWSVPKLNLNLRLIVSLRRGAVDLVLKLIRSTSKKCINNRSWYLRLSEWNKKIGNISKKLSINRNGNWVQYSEESKLRIRISIDYSHSNKIKIRIFLVLTLT